MTEPTHGGVDETGVQPDWRANSTVIQMAGPIPKVPVESAGLRTPTGSAHAAQEWTRSGLSRSTSVSRMHE